MVLEGLPNELDIYEGILATSMFMMPKRPERRLGIYERILDMRGSLHFVLEDYKISSQNDIEAVEEILNLTQVLGETPVPSEASDSLGVAL
jgi:sporadic carbohydrate cluster protein (TIGR04323 family)